LTNHVLVLLCIAHDPGVRLRDIAASVGITERSAYGIVTDLAAAGYVVKEKDGPPQSLPDPAACAVAGARLPGSRHRRSPGPPRRRGQGRPGADRDRISLRLLARATQASRSALSAVSQRCASRSDDPMVARW
jgi:IclR helix-turn-helix domain